MLSFYEKFANQAIRHFSKRYVNLKSNADLHDMIMSNIIEADCKYDPGKSNLSRKQYLNLYADFALKKFFQENKEKSKCEVESVSNKDPLAILIENEEREKRTELLEQIIANSGLTPTQEKIVRMKLDNKNFTEMGKETNTTCSNTSYVYKVALAKMQEYVKIEFNNV